MADVAKHCHGLNSYDALIVQREQYAESFGISNFKPGASPLTLVAESQVDGYDGKGMLYQRMREFSLYGIGTAFNLSFAEFLGLPRDMVMMMINELERQKAEENKAIERAERESKKAMQHNGFGAPPEGYEHTRL